MKAVFIILFICWWFAQCKSISSELIPASYVSWNVKDFHQSKGIMYLNNQVFSGYQYLLYPTGDTAFICSYFNGKEHGLAKQWYQNGQIKEIRWFDHGRKTGEHKGWWENGQTKFIYHFNKDVYEGSVKEWHQNGQLFRNMHYSNGQETGLQQIKLADGSLYANYEVKNGRTYGLTGTVHCKNYWKDEP